MTTMELQAVFNELRYLGKIKTQTEFGKSLGWGRAFTSLVLNGKEKIPEDTLNKVKEMYHDVDLNAIKPTSIPTTEGPIAGTVVKNPMLQSNRMGEAEVPYYDFDFIAGDGVEFYNDDIERPSYTMIIPGFAGCVAFPSYGDSMERLIRRGSVLFGRKLQDWHSFLEYGQIYGIVMKDNRRFLKYIRKAEDPKNYFLLRSENDKYDDFEVPIKKIKNIWLIEGWMLKTA